MDAQTVAGALQARKLVEERISELESRLGNFYSQLSRHQAEAQAYRDRITTGERELLELRSWLHTAEQ